jgi:hypothetical protein
MYSKRDALSNPRPITLVKHHRVRVELQWLLPYRFLTTKPPELRFHALLSDGAREVRFERVTS